MSLEHASLHKSTLYLLFSPRCLPYAELATYYQSKTPFRLVMGLDHNLLATESRLVINKGPLSDRKTVLVGKFKICNFLNRLSNPAYCKISSDFIFNLQHHFNQSLIADRLKSRNGPLKLADFLAWDKSLVTLAASAKAFESLDPNLARIKSEIAQKLSTAPPLDICKFDIASKLIDIANADPVVVYNSLTESKEADLALPVPLLKLPGNIKDVAASLANQFQPTKYVSHVNATGVILHFTLNRSWLRKETLKNILNLNQTYGTNSTGLGNIAVIDFSSPNIAKPFHAGHLRSTMLGNFVQHILKANGWTTVGINYLGDWGKQYGLLAVAFEMFGNEEQLVQDPIKHLFDIYVQISVCTCNVECCKGRSFTPRQGTRIF
jgi:arginyl-tRNA synthetase